MTNNFILLRSAACGAVTGAVLCLVSSQLIRTAIPAQLPLLLVQMLLMAGGLLVLAMVNAKDLRRLRAAHDRIAHTRLIVRLVCAFLLGYASIGLVLSSL